MLEAKFPDEDYGNWTRLVEDWRMKNQQKHHANRNSQTEKVLQQKLLKHKRNKSIEEISWILREQRKNPCGKKMLEHLEQETTEEQGAMSIDVTNNPFTFCVGGKKTASQTV
jgi:hypothetical protein